MNDQTYAYTDMQETTDGQSGTLQNFEMSLPAIDARIRKEGIRRLLYGDGTITGHGSMHPALNSNGIAFPWNEEGNRHERRKQRKLRRSRK